MNSHEHRRLLEALDRDLSAAEKADLKALLETSPEARTEWAAAVRLRELVGRHGKRPFHPGFPDRVLARLNRPPARARVLVHPAFWAAAASVLTVGIALGLWLHTTTVSVPPGELLSHELPDGSFVELSSGSTLRYRPFLGRSARAVRLQGEAYFDVAHGERPFVVTTFNARIQVLGTRFNVRSWPDLTTAQTQVTLEEGSVEVAALADPTTPLRLVPDQETVVRSDTTAPQPPRTASVAQSMAWRNGGFDFEEESLDAVFAELERRYDVNISYDPEIGGRTYTLLRPHPSSFEDVLDDLCFSLVLKHRRTANGIEVYSP